MEERFERIESVSIHIIYIRLSFLFFYTLVELYTHSRNLQEIQTFCNSDDISIDAFSQRARLTCALP